MYYMPIVLRSNLLSNLLSRFMYFFELYYSRFIRSIGYKLKIESSLVSEVHLVNLIQLYRFFCFVFKMAYIPGILYLCVIKVPSEDQLISTRISSLPHSSHNIQMDNIQVLIKHGGGLKCIFLLFGTRKVQYRV